MSEPLDRDDVIDLLNRLGSDQDDEVLKAARQVHARISAAGMTWELLLVPEEADGETDGTDGAADVETDDTDGAADVDEPDEDEGDDGTDDHPPEDEAPTTPAETEKQNAEALALIEKLLARSNNSEDFRAELEDYKRDIAEGEFAPADHRYISALYKRLGKSR